MPNNRDILTQNSFEIAEPGSAPRRLANEVSVLALGLSGLFAAGDLEDTEPEGKEGFGAFSDLQEPCKGSWKIVWLPGIPLCVRPESPPVRFQV